MGPTELDSDVAELARTAAAVVGADFVGVDIMPTTDGRLVVLELNGAVEFDGACAIDSRAVADAAADALGLTRMPVEPRRRLTYSAALSAAG
jgi:glutathione synthase/RimK-type ligase-like ATP-grasp enzyme